MKYCCKVLQYLVEHNEYLGSPIGKENTVYLMLGMDENGLYTQKFDFKYCPFCGQQLGG